MQNKHIESNSQAEKGYEGSDLPRNSLVINQVLQCCELKFITAAILLHTKSMITKRVSAHMCHDYESYFLYVGNMKSKAIMS